MSDADLAQSLSSASFEQPATSLGTSPTELFSAGYDASKRNLSIYSTYGNVASALQDHLDTVKQKTGQDFGNPLADYATNPKAPEVLANTTRALSELAGKRNDPSLAMPDGDMLFQKGAEKARQSSRDYERLAAGPSTLSDRLAGGIGGLAAGFTDPEFLATNALGFSLIPQGGPVLTAALKSAAGFGAGQLAATIDSFGFKQSINPEYGYGDAAKEVAGAVALGAGTSLVGAGAGAVWRRLQSTAPSVAATIPQSLKDAGTLAERVADLDANNPFRTGLTGATAHRDAISQMSMDLAAGRVPEVPAAALAEAKTPTGQVFATTPEAAPGRVFLGNRAVDVKYELAEASDLITSHDRDFMVNQNYPAELQPRERANVASRAQVIDMAANLEPERLGPSPEANAGAPLVGPDNVVESGNGRAMAIRAAYDGGTDRAGAYRAFLERSGFDTSQTQNPVLIARRTTAMGTDERASFAQSANASASLRMSTTEQALSDARHIGADLTPLLNPGDMGSAANRDFAKAFVAKLPMGERGGMLTQGGQLSASGLQRLRAASVARAYSDPAVIARAFEHPDPNIKTLAAALTDAAPEWIKLKQGVAHGEIPSTHDITPDIMGAVKAIMQARDMGRPVHEILNQGDMFHSDVSGLAARMFFKDAGMKKFLSKADMADNVATAARDIRTSAEAGPGLFDQRPITPKEALTAHIPANERLTLHPTENKYHDESVNAQEYSIRDAHGAERGVVELGLKPGDDTALQVHWIGREREPEFGSVTKTDANTLGPSFIRKLIPEVRRLFPTAKTLEGSRISGSHKAMTDVSIPLPRLTAEEVAKIQADPSFHDAMFADLRRAIDRGEAHIGMTEDGKPIPADPEFHAAEQQEMLAKEIGNCVTGGPAE